MGERLSKEKALKRAGDIVLTLNKMGWNLYARSQSSNPTSVIEQGPVESPSLNQGYVLLPLVEEPLNLSQVQSALDKVAQKLNRRLPEISLDEDSIPMTGFSFHLEGVHIHSPSPLGVRVSYDRFITALSTFPNILER